ncbi:MAG: EthD family reductase [Candidatus Obscuribacterales bacterium]|nr:EthD family reductase [Candidatus Obscuribacterales bacterium]
MHKLVALYKKPENAQDFDNHYFNVHMPLANKMPGLRKAEISKILGTPQGDADYHLLAELYFDDLDAIKAALGSPEGREAGKDLMGFAGKLVSLYFAKVEDKVPAAIK